MPRSANHAWIRPWLISFGTWPFHTDGATQNVGAPVRPASRPPMAVMFIKSLGSPRGLAW